MAELALVSGGDRGIGRAISENLARQGYDIIIVARDGAMISEEKARLEALGVKSWGIPCDLMKKAQIKRMAKQVVSEIGVPDILINNAGVAFNRDVVSMSDDEIEAMVGVNLLGLVHCTKAFLPPMLKRGKGIVINISSGAGKSGYAGLAVYCATKFAVIGFTESLAQEVAEKGVKVYAICPGATDTDMYRSLYPGDPPDFSPADVAIEISELIKNAARIAPGSAIDVRKR